MFFSLSIFGILAPLIFSIIDAADGRYISSLTELFYFLVVLFIVWGYLVTRNKLLFHLSFLITLALFTFLLVTGGEDGGGIVWFTIFPPMVFYVLRKRWAFLWALLGLIVITLFFFKAFMGNSTLAFIPKTSYQYSALLQLLIAYLVIFTLTTLIFSLLEFSMERLQKALEDIKREKRKFISIFRNSPYGNVIYSEDLSTLMANGVMYSYLLSLNYKSLKEFLEDVLEEETLRKEVVELKGKYLKIIPYHIGEDLRGVVVEDITQQVEMSRKLRSYLKARMDMRAIELLNAFTFQVIHDLKNSIMKVYTPLQEVYMRAMDSGDEVLAKMAEISYKGLSQAVERFRKLKEDLSDLSIKDRMSLISLNELLKEVKESFLEGLGSWRDQLEVSLLLRTDEDLKIWGERYSLKKALESILNNSFEAIKERAEREEGEFKGKITISLNLVDLDPQESGEGLNVLLADEFLSELSREQEGKRYALISVEDNGIGSDNIIEAFNPSISTKELSDRGGLGLGLFIVFKVVSAHGGVISPHSRKGKGTKIDIYLPLAKGER